MCHSLLVVVLCVFILFTNPVQSQTPRIEPVRVSAGTILTFHLQTRLSSTNGNAMDALPKGTVLRVKMLDSIDSSADRDGREFRGSMVSSVVAGDQVVVQAEAQVRGLLALLRSRSHPEGFRYELLVTGLIDHGKSYTLTASLNPSFSDTGSASVSAGKDGTKGN
jgi:hypothetical protein